MSDLIWQKPDSVVDARIMRFLAGDDVVHDRELLPYDIRASRAHAEGLARIGILDERELAALLGALDALADDVAAGRFVLDARHEDMHSAIESRLIETLGDTGRKIHTGRSRNDQVLVASRLWLKDRLKDLGGECARIAHALLERARREAALPLPGYTHLQRAMVSSAGMWLSGFAEAFVDDAALAQRILDWIDANPLGTAAGYGVNLPLARDFTTERLGFARLQVSPVHAQLSRGKFELEALSALGQALLDLRRFAWDLSLYTTSEFGFVKLPPEYTTGSSLMPNKRNPDLVELLRASYAVAAGASAELSNLLSLPSGYQRDLQFTKGPVLRALRHGLDALALVPDLVARFQWDEARLRAAVEPAMHATDLAIESARAGVPFRQAYRDAAAALDALGDRTAEQSLAARTSPGGAAELRLDALAERLDEVSRRFREIEEQELSRRG